MTKDAGESCISSRWDTQLSIDRLHTAWLLLFMSIAGRLFPRKRSVYEAAKGATCQGEVC